MTTRPIPVGASATATQVDAGADPTDTRVIVAAGAFLQREGIARLLERAADVQIVGWASSEQEMILAVESEAPDVLVVHGGIGLARPLREEYPGIGVVAIGPLLNSQEALRLFGSGAGGRAYLVERYLSSAEELLTALREVASGGSVLHPRVVDALVHAHDGEEVVGRLTAREVEVLALVARGLSNAAIAERLSLSKRGVEKHIGAIFSHFRLHDSPGINPRVAVTLTFLHGGL